MHALFSSLIFLILFATPVLAGDFEDGIAAANSGDLQKAFRLWEPLAKQGNVAAQHNLGLMYSKGHGVSKDNAKAISWYRKAAEQGNARSQTNLGLMYYDYTVDAPDDLVKAFYWWSKAAELGNPVAQYYLGEMYDIGKGAPMDPAKAISWYRKAAEQEHAYAQISLGGFYEHGRGTPTDHEKAIYWYRKAAAGAGNSMVSATAQYILGEKYYRGFGVPTDLAKAISLFSKAAEQGHVTAKERLEEAKEKELTEKVQYTSILLWLNSIGMERYLHQFVINNITIDILPELTDANLKEMGIASLGNRMRILKAIKEWPVHGTE